MGEQGWKADYQLKIGTSEAAISEINPGDKVFLAPFCNEPQSLVEELVRQKERLQGTVLYNAVIGSPCLYAEPSCHDYFSIRTILSTPRQKRNADYVPMNLSDFPRWIEEERIDVALIQAGPPDGDGYCNLGISVDVVQSLVKHTPTVICQVNERLPRTFGDTQIHTSNITRFIHSSREPLTLDSGTPSDIELEIGRNVASLIPDYATIQIGLGKIADSVLAALEDKKGLGIHSGSITDAAIKLIELGVVTNERKEINTGRTICTTLTGSGRLYAFADGNHSLDLRPVEYTHNPAVIAAISNFYSVNSALEVDLGGQVNAEQLGSSTVAGVGGQMDFIMGAQLSKGGRSIIALPSTARKGTESRIKAAVTAVSSLKSHIDYVVTEYGSAKLFGKSMRERAEAMIAIAHPDFRSRLEEEFVNSTLLF